MDVVVIAPHADDETLGCGGTLLRHVALGDRIHWVLVTAMSSDGYSERQIASRRAEIDTVRQLYGFTSVSELGFPITKLDFIGTSDLVSRIDSVINSIKPEVIYLPFPGDIHTDHKVVFLATASVTKWFRYPSVRKVLACEIQSETDFAVNYDGLAFRPNHYVEITPWLDRKVEILSQYIGEFSSHPFPRSIAAVRALALLRGAQCGCEAAEAFMILKEVVR